MEGMNPYVEELHVDDEFIDEEFYQEEDEKMESITVDKELMEWENPSYLVKDLDTGESYRVEEIGQQFTLVTLDSMAAQHEHK